MSWKLVLHVLQKPVDFTVIENLEVQIYVADATIDIHLARYKGFMCPVIVYYIPNYKLNLFNIYLYSLYLHI